MKSFILRNILVFLKDRMAVLFSFLAVFVVYFLYLCFLKDAMLKEVELQFPMFAEEICNRWVMAGTVGILTLTSSLSVLGILISDRSQNLLADFQLTPLSSSKLVFGYIMSTTIITFGVAMVSFIIGEWYIYVHDGKMLKFIIILKVCGILWLAIFACTSVLFCFLIWFKSTSSFSNITTIVGTLSGFLMGIYIPIGSLPIFLQVTVRFFPFSHGTTMLRQVMMEDVLQRAIPNALIRDDFEAMFGLVYHYGDVVCTPWMSISLLVILALLGYLCACFFMKILYKYS